MTSIHHSICISSFHWRTLPFALKTVRTCDYSSPQTDIDTRNGMQQSIAHSLLRKEWHITPWNKNKRFPQKEPPLDSESAIQAIPCLVMQPTPYRRRLDDSQHRMLNRRRESSCDQNRLQFAKPIVPLFFPNFWIPFLSNKLRSFFLYPQWIDDHPKHHTIEWPLYRLSWKGEFESNPLMRREGGMVSLRMKWPTCLMMRRRSSLEEMWKSPKEVRVPGWVHWTRIGYGFVTEMPISIVVFSGILCGDWCVTEG